MNENGKATWMWIENDRSGNTNVKQKKYGTWTATENKISISIQGNTDIIKEEFELKRGIFIDTLTKRYLERTQ